MTCSYLTRREHYERLVTHYTHAVVVCGRERDSARSCASGCRIFRRSVRRCRRKTNSIRTGPIIHPSCYTCNFSRHIRHKTQNVVSKRARKSADILSMQLATTLEQNGKSITSAVTEHDPSSRFKEATIQENYSMRIDTTRQGTNICLRDRGGRKLEREEPAGRM